MRNINTKSIATLLNGRISAECKKIIDSLEKYTPVASLNVIDKLFDNANFEKKKILLEVALRLASKANDAFKPWLLNNDTLKKCLLFVTSNYTPELVEYVAKNESISFLKIILENKDKFTDKEIIMKWINDPNTNKINKTVLEEIYSYLESVECIKH